MGSKIYLPVFVEGANFSTGDMHFSQGDGEVSFCGAIEMSGFLELKYITYLIFIAFAFAFKLLSPKILITVHI